MSTSHVGGVWGRAIQAVVSVFAAFGGFVMHIQPPEEAYRGFPIAFAGALSALLLLLLSAVGREAANSVFYRRICMALSAVLIAGAGAIGVTYQNQVLTRTADIPGVNGGQELKVVIGTEYTAETQRWMQNNPCSTSEVSSCSNAALLVHFGLDRRDLVWTEKSILESVRTLNNTYLAFAVLLSSSVFVLLECLGEHILEAKDGPEKGV